MKETTALAKRETVDVVAERIRVFRGNGEIQFPENYSPENALKSAWLTIQETKDKNGKAALEVCTKESIANALLSMVIQGLNPDKKQCYFIVYGDKLQLQRSYFGSIAVAKQVNEDIEDIIAEVIYIGDNFKTSKKRSRTFVLEHEQDFENIDKANIAGAYATILYKDGTDESVVMTIAQIHQAWKQSKMGVFDDKGKVKDASTHGKFAEEMAKKTVINRAAKMKINTSDDHNIVIKNYRETEDALSEASAKEESDKWANKKLIQAQEVEEVEAEEVVEKEPQKVDTETGEITGPDF
jgi:recombination protein RecT